MAYSKQDPSSIQSLFDSIASSYDTTNQWISLSLHKRWNKKLVQTILQAHPNPNLLDLCAGTGEITFSLLKACEKILPKIFLLDFSQQMLEEGKKRARNYPKQEFEWIQADAQKIPLDDDSFDVVSTAYGIRNIQNPSQCAQEVFRVLKKGGIWVVLELTRPKNPFLRLCHKIYLSTLLPLIGRLRTSNKKAYSYLSQSVQSFISPQKLSEVILSGGFSSVSTRSFLGGTATLFIAKK